MPLNIINYTPLVEEDGTVTPLNRIRGTLLYGQAWYKDIQAQETIVSRLQKLLSDRFTLIRNFTLPEEEIPIPLLLISGAGIWLIATTNSAGIFKTEGKEMLEFVSKKEEFVLSQPNLVLRTLLLSRAFEKFLKIHNIVTPEIEPVLIFTNPGVDVTTGDSNIRVLLIDALNRFVTGLQSTPVRMEPGTSKRIIELIGETRLKTSATGSKKSGGIRLNFTSTQWIILAILMAILVLSGLLLITLLLTI
jgi:hypothetical protein